MKMLSNKLWPFRAFWETAMNTIQVHITSIKPGDTILHDGVIKTVCPSNIKHDAFMGTTLFGDSYMLGTKLVHKVI